MQKTCKNLGLMCLAALAILSPQLALPASGEQIAMYRGSDRQARLEDGAKREGEVVWYTSFQTDDANQFIQLFERRYPFVKVKLLRLTSERVLERYLMEFQTHTFLADIIDTNDFQMELPRRKRTLQPYYTPSVERFDKRFVQPQGYWVASRLTMIVNGYNTRMVKPNEVPKRYEDLLDPKWVGKMSLEREQTEWFMALMEHWGAEKGKAFFQKLGAQKPT
jgi:iron(III) transport system substrate-binding protein